MTQSIHPFWLIAAAAALGMVPMLLALVTCYLKVSIVLGMLRTSLGTQQVPSGAVLMALSVGLTFFVMAPVWEKTVGNAAQLKASPLSHAPGQADLDKLATLLEPLREFMKAHTGRRESAFFSRILHEQMKEAAGDPEAESGSLRVILPAFVFSELKQAFAMGFVVMLPFLVVDMVVANILVGMGMYMVSPVMISLPIKLILFVASDAWLLLAKGLIFSYGV